MNKKGAILHWTFAIFLVAIILFLSLQGRQENVSLVKGEWQVEFLQDNYFQAERELLEIDAIAKEVGISVIGEIASNGGYLESSSCGNVNGVALWKKDCLLGYDGATVTLAETLLEQQLPEIEFSEVGFTNGLFWAKGPEQNVSTEDNSYFYKASFAIPFDYNLNEEYNQLQQDAFTLVAKCQAAENLQECLNEEKLLYWEVGNCNGDYIEIDRKVVFCASSPFSVRLPFGSGTYRSFQHLEYQFALDFTPTTPFSLVGVTVDKVGEDYLLQFPLTDAESYRLHYTDWPDVMGAEGIVEEIFPQGISLDSRGFVEEHVSIDSPSISSCSPNVANLAYLCDDQVLYLLKDTGLVGLSPLSFAVTAIKNSEESPISEFITME